MEVTHRLKVLDLTDKVPDELWVEVHNTIQEVVTKTICKKKKCISSAPNAPNAPKLQEKEMHFISARKRNAPMQNGCLRRLTNSQEEK